MGFIDHDDLARQSEVAQHHVPALERPEQGLIDGPDHELGERSLLPAAQPVVGDAVLQITVLADAADDPCAEQPSV
ncbi:MAG: hypothetical protein ACRDXB_08705, partial [Actinomycetes bacterium]